MKYSSKTKKLLGLSGDEAKILSVLCDSPQRTSDIEKRIDGKIPRTTLIRLLQRLHHRGFLAKHKYSARRGGWILADISDSFRAAEHDLLGHNEIHVSHEEHEVIVYRGKKELLTLADKAYHFAKGERVYWILPDSTKKAWDRNNLIPRMQKVGEFFEKRGVLVDMICSEDLAKYFIQEGVMFSLRGLVTFAHMLPKEFLSSSSDIMVFRDSVSIMNWEDLVAIEIKNKDLVQMFKGLIRFIHQTSKQVPFR